MNDLISLVIGDLTEFNDMTMFVVICRLIVLGLCLETFGVICGYFANFGKRC